MNVTTIRAGLAAMTAAVAAPAMLFLGAGSATATGSPGGGPDDPENSPTRVSVNVGSASPAAHPDFDWRPIAPAARPGSSRTAPASGAPTRVSFPEPQIKPRFEPETF